MKDLKQITKYIACVMIGILIPAMTFDIAGVD